MRKIFAFLFPKKKCTHYQTTPGIFQICLDCSKFARP